MTKPAITVEEMNSFLSEHAPFATEFNVSCEEIGVDLGVARFTYDERWTRPGSIVNGGTLMVLADLAVYVAVFSRVGIVPLAVTSELKMNFLRPAMGHDVLARATFLKIGRRVAFAAVELYEERDPDRLVAHATSSYVLPSAS